MKSIGWEFYCIGNVPGPKSIQYPTLYKCYYTTICTWYCISSYNITREIPQHNNAFFFEMPRWGLFPYVDPNIPDITLGIHWLPGLTLCNPIDGSPPGSPVPGILQARTLEWVAISFSIAWKWKVKVKSLSRVWLFTTPWTAAYQAPPSMGFSRQEYWSGVPVLSPIHWLETNNIRALPYSLLIWP